MSGKPVFSCYVTNMAKLDEGEVLSACINFPTTKEIVFTAFKSIGLQGINSGEYELLDFESSIPNLQPIIDGNGSIDELNYLANLVSEMTPAELKVFDSTLENSYASRTISASINLALNLDKITLIEGIRDEVDYGLLLQTDAALAYSELVQSLEKSSDINMQALAVYIRTLEKHFDAGSYGEEISKRGNGRFTHLGYLYGGQKLEEIYDAKVFLKNTVLQKQSQFLRLRLAETRTGETIVECGKGHKTVKPK